MQNVNRTYLPAAGHDWALPLYDPFVKLLGGDKARQALIVQAALPMVGRVLDIGCGTGALAVLLKEQHPKLDVVGLDPDPKALNRARRKANRASVSIRFDQGSADRLPYPDASFDRVLSSFMFHHLRPDQRAKMLQEASRVLVPGGSLHLLDFERPEGVSFLGRLLCSNHHLDDNLEQRILALLQQAGFASREKIATDALLFGLLRTGYYRAKVKERPEL